MSTTVSCSGKLSFMVCWRVVFFSGADCPCQQTGVTNRPRLCRWSASGSPEAADLFRRRQGCGGSLDWTAGWWRSGICDCAAVMRRCPGGDCVWCEGRERASGTIRRRTFVVPVPDITPPARGFCCMTGSVPMRSGCGPGASRCCVTWERVRVGSYNPCWEEIDETGVFRRLQARCR
jgi:hypothetical protein